MTPHRWRRTSPTLRQRGESDVGKGDLVGDKVAGQGNADRRASVAASDRCSRPCWRFSRSTSRRWWIGWIVAAAVNTAAVRAQDSTPPPTLVLDDGFRQQSIGASTAIFIDVDRNFDLAAIQRLATSRFVPSTREVPSFGFSRSAFWVRIEVDNRRSVGTNWLLEVGYPPLDLLDLYGPTENGRIKHSAAGDYRPFGARDVKYRNTTFNVTTPPGRQVYYLRVVSSCPVTIPLKAWSPSAFLDGINGSYPQLWMFYGCMVVMGLYNLFLFFAVREAAYLHYVLYIVSFTLFEAAFNGLAFQYLWPNWIWWTNRCIPLLIGMSCATGIQFLRSFINTRKEAPRFDRLLALIEWGGGTLTVALALVAPSWLIVRVAVALSISVVLSGLPVVVMLALRGQRQARYFLVAWMPFLLGIVLFLMTTIGVLAVTPVTAWTIQIGAAAEVVLLSLGLADRINRMRRDLGNLNTKLEHNVLQLTEALERAEQSRKAKNAFLAGVSHELRTPLNAIINIPEGILESFRSFELAHCSGCGARFELDAGEQLDAAASCPECGQAALHVTVGRVFEGDATTTAVHLEHVHRAGSHLLEVVTDILDVSKLEAGRMRLTLGNLELGAVLLEALEPMYDFAKTQGVSLEWPTNMQPMWVRADRVKLKQIVLNLVSNAIKFSDGRGVVRVSVLAEADYYRVGVHDQGIGIREEDKQRIFEGFEQGTVGEVRRFGGTGLGLSITKQLVALHAGELWLTSELGKGSDFYFQLPRAPQDSAQRSITAAWDDRTSARAASS
jgi:two-component system, sensor histidine kinase LadS